MSCITVGDSPSDVQAAHDVGLPAIAVTWGIGEYRELIENHPDAMVANALDLSTCIFKYLNIRKIDSMFSQQVKGL